MNKIKSKFININMKFVPPLLLILFFPTSSYAYIDPGTGGIIIQMIIGAFASVIFFFGNIKAKIKKVLIKIFKKNNEVSKDQ